MSASKRRLLLRSLFPLGLSCGCGPTRRQQPDVFHPTPKPKSPPPPPSSTSSAMTHKTSSIKLYASSSSSYDKLFNADEDEREEMEIKNTSTTTLSLNNYTGLSPSPTTQYCSESENDPNPSKTGSSPYSCSKIGESIAVVKESVEPYFDFRQSMLQMIFEKEIYSREDLQELLNCFLQLNSPCHHDVIVRAFTEISSRLIISPANNENRSEVSSIRRNAKEKL
ncbi:hypothetical protein Ancab_007510 [Ancistrocladus abbreviatus]